MDVFHGWILAIIVSVAVIVAVYLSTMWFLMLLEPAKPKSRKRPWWWDLRRKRRR